MKNKLNGGVFKRVLKTLIRFYPVLVPVTAICILFSSIVSTIPSVFVQNVIAVIQNWFESGDWNSAKAEIIPLVVKLVVLYILSVISIAVYTQLMAYITQGFCQN